ncbi:MAG: pyruvate, phosphate dikinase, partial [Clostridiales bacterium]
MSKFVYHFKEGDAGMKNLLGGKGANLAEMTRLGMPIPQGFIITTEACNEYYRCDQQISAEIKEQIDVALRELEKNSGKKFGDTANPLLVSVRSGGRASMPGMMDTILNLGLTDVAVEALAERTGNPRFAYDSYRRFIQMFADVVKEIAKSRFERVLDGIKESKGIHFDTEMTAADLKEVINSFKAIYKENAGEEFPQDPHTQLMEAVTAVFRSWNNPRAVVYRRMNDIPGDWGTAVNVQMMVFGNMGDTSGTGVAFTRNPATGEKKMFGEYLINAQGEDVVAGIRTPKNIAVLAEDMPTVYAQFVEIATTLENHYKDMQDMEFTIEDKKLYFLQTRNGKRTAAAALKVAVDLVDEGMISEKEALLKVDPKQLDQLLHPTFDQAALKAAKPIGSGLPASPGSAAGKLYFSAEDAKQAHNERKERVVLARLETSPEDIEGMVAAEGIITVRGGMTSHAAVVARGMGTCCVAGCGEAKVDEAHKTVTLGGVVLHEGDYVSLDGSTGKIYAGDVPTSEPAITGDFARFMSWTDKYRKLGVRANADTPQDALNAVGFGAEGIGLTRTEHMFFNEDRIPRVRQMILAKNEADRRVALAY